MSQDTFITRMMAETFENDDTVVRSRSIHPDQDFRLRRGLSKLPVISFEGSWIAPGLARFSFHGTMIDLPSGHRPVLGWSMSDGAIAEKHALIQACGQLLGTEFSHVFVMQSEDEKPWLIFWNAKDDVVDVVKLRELFRTKDLISKAA
jgi:hypothetical protein